MSEDPNALSSGLIYEGQLPVFFRRLSAAPDAVQLGNLQSANQEVLRGILALEELSGGRAEDHGQQSSEEFERIDAKLNLLLDLVSQVLALQVSVPDPVRVILTPGSLVWMSSDPPDPGSHVQIDLYLHPAYPRPLTLVARVEGLDSQAGGFRASARFEGLSDAVEQGLEKFIFRHHRRLVAQARRG